MQEFAKFVHLLGLMLGAGGALGTMAIAMRTKGDPASPLNALRPVFGRMGLAGILLLWAAGLWLYLGFYRGADLGLAFGLKLVAALIVLALSIYFTAMAARAARSGTPPPAFLPRLRMVSAAMVLIAVALAVYVFN
jgi:hypothetical protein